MGIRSFILGKEIYRLLGQTRAKAIITITYSDQNTIQQQGLHSLLDGTWLFLYTFVLINKLKYRKMKAKLVCNELGVSK